MIHSKISPYIELKSKRISILEAARKTIEFYKKLSLIESKFNVIKIISETASIYDSIEIGKLNAIEQLAEEILNQNIKEIRKYDSSEEIGVNYSNSKILSYALTSVYENDDSILTLAFCFTTSEWVSSSIGSIVSHEFFFKEIENCISFIKSAIEVFDVNYATIRPTNDRQFTKRLKKYKHNSKLGSITFYSNNLNYVIPNKITDLIIEDFSHGKLIKLNEFKDLEKVKKDITNFMEEFEKTDSTIMKN